MSIETYENLVRVQERRKAQAARAGNWKAVREAVAEIARLTAELNKSKP